MIAQLKGILESKTPAEIVVDVGGVGYLLAIPLSTYYGLPEVGSGVRLLAHTHVREDALQIFGFLSSPERDLFRLLISVSKVGPRMALAILSGLDTATLYGALRTGDVARLTGIAGVGKKTAERICMELKDKVPESVADSQVATRAGDSLLEECRYKDALTALIHLGYKRSEVKEVIQGLASEDEALTVEELIRESLRLLSTA